MLLALVALFFISTTALAGKVAVLPVEDLSVGENGLNPRVTARLREALQQKGLLLAGEEEIVDFMARNRIRWLGRLDSSHVSRLRQELGVDFLLLGSVNQLREKDPAAFALTMQLVRTSDARLIWSGGAELSRADVRRLLAIAEPQDLGEIEDLVIARAMAEWPATLPEATTVPLEGLSETIHLQPEVVRPGETVRCRIRLDDKSALAETQVSVVVDNKIVWAEHLAQEQLYEASWPAPAREGRYPVSVIISSRVMGTKNVLAGGFLVDGRSPELILSLRGQELDGAVVLNKQLTITPGLKEPEPLNSWEIEVLDATGQRIKAENGRGNLPGRFAWWGQRQDGTMAADGDYLVRLTAVDRAGNTASAEKGFQIIRAKPELKLTAAQQGEGIQIDLDYLGKVPLVHWRLELRSGTGSILQDASGEKMPARIFLPLEGSNGKISAHLSGQDVLGSTVRQTIADILAHKTGQAQVVEEEKKTDVWSIDF